MLSAPAEGEVHVWRVRLDAPAAEDALELLSQEERERAARFHFSRDARRYVAAHRALRAILAGYTARAPAEIRFAVGERGKPSLEDGSPLRFNLSHSGERALVAVAWAREVGVDLEQVEGEAGSPGRARDAGSLLDLARSIFSDAEVRALVPLCEGDVPWAFFRCWTRKEAFVKATGLGLSLDLKRFDVSLAAGDQRALLATRPDANWRDRWSLWDLPVEARYEGALAVEGVCRAVVRFDFEGA